ncbi:MAG: helix-turn-helix transcriptional regulator [Spirochaetes bacterium]|nr:helix-turn-helix transcriptional regulator [Spirochaetota bacterium]
MDLVNIARIIKETRLKQDLTIETVARKTGVSKGFISRLENFRVTPSIKTLSSIADALGITMSHFFETKETPPCVFGTLDTGEAVDRDDAGRFGMQYTDLAFRKLDRAMKPFLITYSPSKNKREFLAHDNDEFFLLLDGAVDFLLYDETNVTPMKAGATAYLSKNIPHTVRLSKGTAAARALIVYC